MKIYFADTNFFLRFLLQDNLTQAQKVEDYLDLAKKEKIKIVYLVAVIIEMEVVLRKVYHQQKIYIAEQLLTLIQTPYLVIEDRGILIKTFELFKKYNLDLLDLLLLERAKSDKAEVLTFDKKLIALYKKQNAALDGAG